MDKIMDSSLPPLPVGRDIVVIIMTMMMAMVAVVKKISTIMTIKIMVMI